MSVLIYAHRFKCNLCGNIAEVKPEGDGMSRPPVPGGWLHIDNLSVGKMVLMIDLCPWCACRPINEVMINLERKP